MVRVAADAATFIAPAMRNTACQSRVASTSALDSGTYEVEHQKTGRLMMYLDAHKRGADGLMYRADFNLLE